MAMIAVRVPHDIARLLSTLDVPGEKEPQDHLHVTLVNMGDGVPIDQLAATVEAVFPVARDTQPFTAQVSQVSTFPQGNNGVPIICPINSTGIYSLQKDIASALDDAGIDYSKKFPIFKPHVTLGYSNDPLVEEAVNGRSFPAVEWGVGEVVLFGGDSGDGTFVATFPFALEPSRKVANRRDSTPTTVFRALLRLADMKTRMAHDENGVCQATCSCHSNPNSHLAEVFPSQHALQEYMEEHPGADRANHSVRVAPTTHIRDEKPEGLKTRLKALQKDLDAQSGIGTYSKKFPQELLDKVDKGEEFSEKEWQRLHAALWARKLAARVLERFKAASV